MAQQSASSTKTQSENGIFENLVVGVSRGIASQVFESMSFSHVGHVRQHANPGDLIEFHRGLFSHYALYLGEGYVMNIGAEDKNTTEALIRVEKLEDVCKSSKVRVRNHDDVAKKHFLVSPKSPREIILAAKVYQNRRVPYEFDFRNCEYYSTLWRYGKGFSTQAAKPTATPAGSFVGELVTSWDPLKAVFGVTQIFREAEWFEKYKRLAKS